MKVELSKNLLAGTSVVALFAMPASALAQDAQTSASDESDNVIVVTARKTEENLLETPIAVTAFSEEAITELGLTNIEDLPAFTPGFVFESFQGIPGRFDSSPRFRGIGVNTINPTRTTASVFMDGVYVANGSQGIQLNDVSRVEIIKGPQSAFFGRNTFAGAVNYISKRPGDDFAVDFSAEAATRDEYAASIGIDIPLGDGFAARLSGSWRDKGGHYSDRLTGDEIGDEETWSVTGTLFLEPSDNFDAMLRVNYFQNRDGAPATAEVGGLPTHNCGAGLGTPSGFDTVRGLPLNGGDTVFCGSVSPSVQYGADRAGFGDTDSYRPAFNFVSSLSDSNRTALLNTLSGRPTLFGPLMTELGLERDSLRASLQFNMRVPDSSLVFSSLTGINYDEVNLFRDADGTSANQFYSYSQREFRDISQEFRVSGESFGDLLNWSMGANYFDQRFTSNGGFIVPALGFAGLGTGNPDQTNAKTFGIFGSAILDFTDQLSLTLEGRYQEDTISEDNDITGGAPALEGKFKNFLPRVILDYQITPDTLVYASYSEGNNPGGFNTSVRALNADQRAQLEAIEPRVSENFDEETLKNYEIGWKQAFGNKGMMTLAAFYMERTGQAVRRSDILQPSNPPLPGDVITVAYDVNIGSTEIKGVELEGSYEVFPGLTLSGSLAYIDAQVELFEAGTFNEVYGTPDASGSRTDRFPKWSGSFSAAYEASLSDDLDFFVRADAIYAGSNFGDETNITSAPGGERFNIRAGVVTSNDIRIEAFVTNLTDDDTPTAINRSRDLSDDTGLFDFSTYGYTVGLRDRRQFGIRVSGSF